MNDTIHPVEQLPAAQRAARRRIIALLDLTDLRPEVSPRDVASLVERSATPLGPVAGIVVRSGYIGRLRRLLSEGPDRPRAVAAVNFPDAHQSAVAAVGEAVRAVERGADEIDLVFPWRSWLSGDRRTGPALIAAVRREIGATTLKVILESGAYPEGSLLQEAALAVVEAGADFLKTSTGTNEADGAPIPGASTEAVEALLGVAARPQGRTVGVKVSGGVRTLRDAQRFVRLADIWIGSRNVHPGRFRIGASSLLEEILGETPDPRAVAEAG
jgi:deoxyribose-phosphate aldolase